MSKQLTFGLYLCLDLEEQDMDLPESDEHWLSSKTRHNILLMLDQSIKLTVGIIPPTSCKD